MPKGRVRFVAELCKACQLCVRFCPKDVLSLDKHIINVLGYHPVKAINPDDCNGCATCALMCPDLVITVERE
ncbi:hypothetical protein SYNTR_1282 [Candidatus Syntrophocurvum alkaliphilum]|uniref:4Fe-4S ferredoxin-type domain-containing protein n=1 Tax=Candidatus Syntrophocurvum alkaliphilum TaxID=2293317 RepID=A0A6I6DB16_9FIRM|nr:4Fe-4S binding protein [Candidatus Syntrophocurvum alkaliphilum]QGT99875.1 hypothetical protein SYNTR_1282 [Candidatus Syntrophocurvum alkaliphilum]